MSNDQVSNDQPGFHRQPRPISGLAMCLAMVLTVDASSPGTVRAGGIDPTECCPTATYAADGSDDSAGRRRGAIAADDTPPDQVADYVGGIAARLRNDGTPVPGHLYLMMATVGSQAPARLFEQTSFTHNSRAHVDTIESNRRAIEAAEEITGKDIEPNDFTTAPGGGPSGGLMYLIAYLNVVSRGAFTGQLSIAATGELGAEGYIDHVKAVDEKLGAARLAGVDVLFTSSAASHTRVAEHAARRSGHTYRSRYGRATLTSERGLDDYEAWGATRPKALDVVVVGHIADVAAYLCGTASAYACAIADQLGATTTSDTLTARDIAPAVHTAYISRSPGQPS